MGSRGRRIWLGGIALSIVLHGVAVLAVNCWPGRSAAVASLTPQTKRAPGVGLEGSAASGKGDGGGAFSAKLSAPLLIEPQLAAKSTSADASIKNGAKKWSAFGSPATAGHGGHASGAGGPGTRFFAVGTQAKRIVYVVDASASMGKNGVWRQACNELVASIKQLPADAHFQVILYNRRARTLLPTHPAWIRPEPDLLQAVARALDETIPEGQTDHEPALRLALLLRPEAVFFLTDADDFPITLVAKAQSWNHSTAAIHAVELCRNSTPRAGVPLRLLAQQHRGEYRAVVP